MLNIAYYAQNYARLIGAALPSGTQQEVYRENIIQRSNSGMPARTNVRLSVGKSIYKSCTTLSSQLGTFLWNTTMGYIRSVEYAHGIYQKCGICPWDISEVWNMPMGYIRSVEYAHGIYQKIFSSLILSYSKVTHLHYGRHVTDCSWLSSAVFKYLYPL